MNNILLVVAVGVMNLLSFYLGAKLSNGEKVNIELSNLNPVKKIEEYKEKKDEQKERERLEIIKQNIDNYDGTSEGQKDIP